MRDLPVVGWLIATVIVALAHPFVPAPRWLLIHLVLLGAATHSILVWSRYFADALLHTASDPSDRPAQNRRLVLLNLGTLLVVSGVMVGRWPVTVLGGAAIGVAVAWHGAALHAQLRAALSARFAVTVRYYVAAAALLPVGVALGVVLARVQSDPWHQRLVVAHASTNLLGWLGLAALGTLLTLWPTMLRTRIVAGAERASARALPVLLIGVALAAGGPLADSPALAALGWLVYLLGVGLLAPGFVAAARARPPRAFATWSVAAALLWLVGSLIALVTGALVNGVRAEGVLADGAWPAVDERLTWFTPFLAAGFGAQLLLGAMSYLVPVVLGGGPRSVRVATAVLDRAGPSRVVAANAALLVCVLPVPPAVRVLCSAVALVALASFLPLLVLALRASRTARTSGEAVPAAVARNPARLRRQVAAALAIVVVAALTGVGIDRGGVVWFGEKVPVAAGVARTGHTTVVEVEARDMRFTPATISVPAGNRLVIVLTNTDDEDIHDLVLDTGAHSGRLAPGENARVDVGVVGRDLDGWCSVVGHKQMGMVFNVDVTGTAPSTAADMSEGHAGHQHGPGGNDGDQSPAETDEAQDAEQTPATDNLDLMAEPSPGWTPRDAALPPLSKSRLHRRTFVVRDVEREVAPGVTQRLWTYNGTAPGPVLHGRVGDRFE
ncbi:MAG: cupredoxin domain-containing protein, partial [Marmoricola sp.]